MVLTIKFKYHVILIIYVRLENNNFHYFVYKIDYNIIKCLTAYRYKQMYDGSNKL